MCQLCFPSCRVETREYVLQPQLEPSCQVTLYVQVYSHKTWVFIQQDTLLHVQNSHRVSADKCANEKLSKKTGSPKGKVYGYPHKFHQNITGLCMLQALPWVTCSHTFPKKGATFLNKPEHQTVTEKDRERGMTVKVGTVS